MAKGHRESVAAALRLEAIHGAPVLFSGISSIILKTTDTSALKVHYKEFLLAGSLPAEGQLHFAQISLLAMLAQDQESIPTRHTITVLSSLSPIKS